MKKLFFILIPAKGPGYYGGLLATDIEQIAIDLSLETGGAYVPSSYSLS